MRYSGGLSKKEREQIFSLFIDKRSLKFSQIEKSIKIRSNLVAYHLDRMRKEGLMESDDSIVKDKGHGPLEWFSVKQMDGVDMIPSDLWLIRNKMKSSLKVIHSTIDEKESEIESFRIIE